MTEVIVVGAGVIGLSAALAIAENSKSLNVSKITVVSEHGPESTPYPPQYTSVWAGAHFRPFPAKNAADSRDYPYLRVTWTRFKNMAQTCPESSVQIVQGIEYLEAPDEGYKNVAPGWSDGVENFRLLPPCLLPSGCVLGASYDTFVVNPPVYLHWLFRKLRFQHDVAFMSRRLEALKEAAGLGNSNNFVVVNCTGNGLQWEGGNDKTCYPVRGQTLLINPPPTAKLLESTVTHQLADGFWTFYIPRPLYGGVILGGTKQPHDTQGEERPADTLALLERGAVLFPQLMKTDATGQKHFDVVGVNVGFRPARTDGVNTSESFHEGVRVINGYGCGGSGYEFSWGVAMKIVETLGQENRCR